VQLCDLYENDSIFDKFDCCINGKGDAIATGSYNNLFRVFGTWNNQDMTLEASRDPMRKRLQTQSKVRQQGTGVCADELKLGCSQPVS
jgi:serine/threonine-protein phosphatase 2A regulatory subunit B